MASGMPRPERRRGLKSSRLENTDINTGETECRQAKRQNQSTPLQGRLTQIATDGRYHGNQP
jgi:hypothetical protein